MDEVRDLVIGRTGQALFIEARKAGKAEPSPFPWSADRDPGVCLRFGQPSNTCLKSASAEVEMVK